MKMDSKLMTKKGSSGMDNKLDDGDKVKYMSRKLKVYEYDSHTDEDSDDGEAPETSISYLNTKG